MEASACRRGLWSESGPRGRPANQAGEKSQTVRKAGRSSLVAARGHGSRSVVECASIEQERLAAVSEPETWPDRRRLSGTGRLSQWAVCVKVLARVAFWLIKPLEGLSAWKAASRSRWMPVSSSDKEIPEV